MSHFLGTAWSIKLKLSGRFDTDIGQAKRRLMRTATATTATACATITYDC